MTHQALLYPNIMVEVHANGSSVIKQSVWKLFDSITFFLPFCSQFAHMTFFVPIILKYLTDLFQSVNLLKTERNLLYISNQSVLHCKHFPLRL
jgi:hypothetical protein